MTKKARFRNVHIPTDQRISHVPLIDLFFKFTVGGNFPTDQVCFCVDCTEIMCNKSNLKKIRLCHNLINHVVKLVYIHELCHISTFLAFVLFMWLDFMQA